MPQKTREQKQRALEKRLKHFEGLLNEATTQVAGDKAKPSSSPGTPTYQYKGFSAAQSLVTKHQSQTHTMQFEQDRAYVVKDILRITALTGAMLVFEGILYYLIVITHLLY